MIAVRTPLLLAFWKKVTRLRGTLLYFVSMFHVTGFYESTVSRRMVDNWLEWNCSWSDSVLRILGISWLPPEWKGSGFDSDTSWNVWRTCVCYKKGLLQSDLVCKWLWTLACVWFAFKCLNRGHFVSDQSLGEDFHSHPPWPRSILRIWLEIHPGQDRFVKSCIVWREQWRGNALPSLRLCTIYLQNFWRPEVRWVSRPMQISAGQDMPKQVSISPFIRRVGF